MSIRKILLFITTLFLMVSCDMADDPSGDSEIATLQVYLTDAPGNFEAVWIDIEEVRIHLSASNENEDEDDGWITVSNEQRRVNLLDLTNGKFEVLGETEIESGRYSQIRLILGSDNEIVKDGVSHHLDTPSAQESGLKININADIEGGQIYTLLLDFDASRSIVEAGKSGKFLLKPVIRTVELAETGSIEGTIEPAESLSWVYAIANEDTITGTKAGTDGDFRLIGLLSGSYDLAINPTEENYPDSLITDVNVTAPDTTRVGIISLED